MTRRIPFNVIQSALYQLLSNGQNDAPVYDGIMDNQKSMPCIWLTEFNCATADTEGKLRPVHRVTQQLDVWSEEEGKKEINGILDNLSTLITSYQLDLNGFTQIGSANITYCRAIGERYADRSTAYHGILIAEWNIEQVDN